jgi:hypothetical protein
VVLWAVIPLPNPWVKGLDFGVFHVLWLEVLLAGFLRVLFFGQVLVGLNLAMDSSWGVTIVPKVLFKLVERFGRSRLGFGGVDPRVLFISSCPGYTGFTGVRDRSDRCNPWWVFCSGEHLDVFAVVMCCSCFEFGSVWRSVGLIGDLGAFRLGQVWPVCCTVRTGVKPLSGSRQLSPAGTVLARGAHRSDRCCHTWFSKENQVQTYMHARIYFHAYSWHKWITETISRKKKGDYQSFTLNLGNEDTKLHRQSTGGLRMPGTSNTSSQDFRVASSFWATLFIARVSTCRTQQVWGKKTKCEPICILVDQVLLAPDS